MLNIDWGGGGPKGKIETASLKPSEKGAAVCLGLATDVYNKVQLQIESHTQTNTHTHTYTSLHPPKSVRVIVNQSLSH